MIFLYRHSKASASFLRYVLLHFFCAFIFCQHSALAAQTTKFAPVPPMGWNSWDAYGTTVREDEVKANADAMAASLKQYGWQYVVVDIQWYEPNAKAHGYRDGAVLTMDENGRLLPATNRFPSSISGAGFKPLADYVHSKGLKFGIHILRGIPRQAVEKNLTISGTDFRASDVADTASKCEWNHDMYGVDMSKPGAQEYYNSLVALYASWGVDFIKADDMSRPYHREEIAALHHAILKSGRPIVLSLSPGPATTSEINDLRDKAEMWRIEDDLWDSWKSVKAMYKNAAEWVPFVSPGHWPDADMLPLGHIGIRAERGDDRLTRLSHEEQRTLMTLWSMLRSPLIFGGDLPSLDPFTLSLLTNRKVLDIDQHSSNAKIVYSKNDLHVWRANGYTKGSVYIAIFNFSDETAALKLPWSEAGLLKSPASIQELWTGKTLNHPASINETIAPHSVILYEVILSSKNAARLSVKRE